MKWVQGMQTKGGW